jgi:hypothetical protein
MKIKTYRSGKGPRAASNLHDVLAQGVYSGSKRRPVVLTLKNDEVKILPSAMTYVKNETAKSMALYRVADDHSRNLISAGLIASAVANSVGQGKPTVTIGDVQRGWVQELSLCGPAEPPYACAVKSIVDRKYQILELPGITGDLMRDAFE